MPASAAGLVEGRFQHLSCIVRAACSELHRVRSVSQSFIVCAAEMDADLRHADVAAQARGPACTSTESSAASALAHESDLVVVDESATTCRTPLLGSDTRPLPGAQPSRRDHDDPQALPPTLPHTPPPTTRAPSTMTSPQEMVNESVTTRSSGFAETMAARSGSWSYRRRRVVQARWECRPRNRVQAWAQD